MQICILAAGKGSRLKNLTSNQPKALLSVHNKSLLQYILDFTAPLTHDPIRIVSGFKHHQVTEWLQNQPYTYQLILNEHQTPGNLSSLLCALPHIHDSFLLCNVDHIYPEALRKRIPQRPDIIGIFGDRMHPLQADDMKFIETSQGTLEFLSKTITKYDGGYIGLTYVGKDFLHEYKTVAEQMFRVNRKDYCVEEVLNKFVKNGNSITILSAEGLRGFEIDRPEDLEKITMDVGT